MQIKNVKFQPVENQDTQIENSAPNWIGEVKDLLRSLVSHGDAALTLSDDRQTIQLSRDLELDPEKVVELKCSSNRNRFTVRKGSVFYNDASSQDMIMTEHQVGPVRFTQTYETFVARRGSRRDIQVLRVTQCTDSPEGWQQTQRFFEQTSK